MEHEPSIAPYNNGDQFSFAYPSARDRWPVILTGAIDDVHRTVLVCDNEEKRTEGKRIIEVLAKLKYELQHNRELTPLPDDGQADITRYNKELENLKFRTWFSVPWLFSECYMYRRMNTTFTLSKHWKSYDVFARQKISTFKSSRPAILELAAKCKELAQQKPTSDEAEKLLFMELCEICLWGNATDLSLLTVLSYDDIQKLQGSEARKASEKNIIVDDLPAAYAALKKAQTLNPGGERRVDIILDNAGFELFVDLVLASYLLSSKLATNIVLHPKSIPWFVSDVIPADFATLLSALADLQTFYTTPSDDEKHAGKIPQPLSNKEVEEASFLFKQWSGFHQEGQLVIRPNRFWTEGGGFWKLPRDEPRLYEDLKESELVIFKGDLNYRKLTGDAMWDPTTPFAEAIGPLGTGSGIRTLTLRTCKGDVIVGLPEGEDERLRASQGGGEDSSARKWAWTGRLAVVQFCDGKA